jgi:glycosyltransferase involved in cell wall biosynthesis
MMNIESTTNLNITGLIFSKDRAMQLQAGIESFLLHCRDAGALSLSVLYKASDATHQRQYAVLASRFPQVRFIPETDFRSQVLQLLNTCRHILFLVDDNLFVREFRLDAILESLRQNGEALGFSLRLGRNILRCYMRDVPPAQPGFLPASSGVVKFSWSGAPHDFGYPLEVSSSVYRTAELLPLLEQLPFANPNTLEGLMAANAQLYASRRPALLCFEQSVAFCNPINMVQTTCYNRAGKNPQHTPQYLAGLFDQSMRIDVARAAGFVPVSCHQEIELPLQKSNNGVSVARPPVTVEMAAWNAEGHIRRAIESILAQNYEPFELVVVDDGSTDSTAAIVNAYKDPRIRYVHQEHKNYAAARNRAICEARGQFLLVVDSDDTIAPGYIEAMVAHAEQHPDADYYYPASLTLVDDLNQPTGAVWRYDEMTDGRALTPVLFSLGKSVIPEPGSLVRRSLYERVGLYHEVETAADFAFLCWNSPKIHFGRVSASQPYYYRVSSGGLSRKFRQRNEITTTVLDEMVSLFPPQVLCPQLSRCNDPTEWTRLYYEFLMMTFYAHAQTNTGRFGEPFAQRGDRYRTLMLDALAASGTSAQSVWGLTGMQRTTAMFRRGVERLNVGRPDEALVYLDEVRRGGAAVPGIDYARAVAFVQLGRQDQAVAACQAELERNRNPDAERLLAELGQPVSVQQRIPVSQTVNQGLVSTM